MDIYKIIDTLNEKTKDHTMLYAYAYDHIKKDHAIGFRSASIKDPITGRIYHADPITDGIVWLIAADAYNTKTQKFIENVHEFETSDMKDVVLNVHAQAIIGDNTVTVQLKSKQCIRRETWPTGTTVVYTKDK